MSAVLIALFDRPATGSSVRTTLVSDGFPTDRVDLISTDDLGRAGLMPAAAVGDKLREYFGELLGGQSHQRGVRLASCLADKVLAGGAVIAVQPRGDIEVKRALELLNNAFPQQVLDKDLDKQAFEHAATDHETPILTWLGKVLAAPGAPDTTGLARLP